MSRKVDFVVVSGDIFDSVRASYRDYLRFFDGLNRLDAEGIPCLPVHRQPRSAESLAAGFLRVAPVRYDARRRSSRFRPVRARRASPCGHRRPRLPEQGVVAQRGHRRGYHPRRRHSGIAARVPPRRLLRWAVLHTGLNARSGEGSHRPRGAAACWIRLLGARPHSQAGGSTTSVCRALPFPAAFKGAMCVRRARAVSTSSRWRVDAPPKVSFIPTASVVWEKVRIDVSDCMNIPALASKTMRELFAVNGDASCEMMVVAHRVSPERPPFTRCLAAPECWQRCARL